MHSHTWNNMFSSDCKGAQYARSGLFLIHKYRSKFSASIFRLPKSNHFDFKLPTKLLNNCVANYNSIMS